MKGIKILYLLLALALPIFVFLFLKFFGKNQFEVVPLYSDGVTSVNTSCPKPPPGSYFIPAEILEQLGWSEWDSLQLFYFNRDPAKKLHSFSRIQEKFSNHEVRISEILPLSVSDTLNSSLSIIQVSDSELSVLRVCYLFVPEAFDLVLVDRLRRIRGYYQLNDREEVDRLLMEATIILGKY